MNTEKLALWVKALESGKYAQTSGVLRADKPDGTSCYCGLGVVVEVAIEDGVEVEWSTQDQRYVWRDPKWGSEDTNSELPAPVQAWLDSGWEDFELDDDGTEVVSANDTYGWGFDEMAKAAREFYHLDEVEA